MPLHTSTQLFRAKKNKMDINHQIKKPWNRKSNTIEENATRTNKFCVKTEPLIAVTIHFSMESTRLTSCTLYNFRHNPSNIDCKLMKTVDGFYSMTSPLSILIKQDGETVHGYGYDAERLYEQLKEENDHDRYYFFKDIALKLVKSFKENVDFQLIDVNGKRLQALTVFTIVVEFLKTDLQRLFRDAVEEHDKYYVLIVPEIFQEIGAIDFMRKAAIKAGINVQTLSVVTEIDAVSVFHQRQLLNQTSGKTSMSGRKFMIVNAGGYFTSIVVHETTAIDVVKESKAVEIRDGCCRLLNKEFKKFCTDLFDSELFKAFKSESRQSWFWMKHEFFLKAFSFKPSGTSTIRLKLAPDLGHNLKERISLQQFSAILISDFTKHMSICSDKICISSEKFQTIIQPAINRVILDIQNAASNKVDVEEIIVFGESMKLSMLKLGVDELFSGKNVTFYEDEIEPALRGAVIIGLGLGHIEKIDRVHDIAIVAAIDFGTTYSGWAYSLRTNFEFDRTKVSMKLWNSGSSQTEKTPTCILIAQDGQRVEAFGYEAEDKYQELVDTEDHESFYFFRRFKMALNKKLGEKLDRHMKLEDVLNRSLPALDVFASSIKFLKDDLVSELQNTYLGTITMDDIHWVLTVPALWTDGSKQFMREAAMKAGIKRKRLTIALEPEAASMYCRSLPITATQCNTGVNISSLSVGTQYMVLDAGGGTIDITVHEVVSENDVREVHAACGGGWGGTTVDEEFKKLLVSLFTEDVYEKFRLDQTDDWLDIWRDFEVKKRAITSTSNSTIRLKLPSSLTDMYSEITRQKLADDVKSSKYVNDIKLVRDKITISAELARTWFTSSVDKTVHMVKGIMSENPNISAILMVGGFSESKVLQNAVKSAFNGINVIVPIEASTSILKGALIFGHLPKVVTERVLKYTYGIESFEKFVPEQHPWNKLLMTDRGVVCQKIFSKHAEVYQRVKNGEPQVWHTYSPHYKSQQQMSFSVYASDRPNPMYTDVNCTQIGKLRIDLDDHDGSLDREVLVAFTFSGTEIVVEAKDKKTGNQTFVALDFLG